MHRLLCCVMTWQSLARGMYLLCVVEYSQWGSRPLVVGQISLSHLWWRLARCLSALQL